MNRQQDIVRERINSTVYDFMEYKNRKPFFRKPIHITVSTTMNESFFMVKNVVYKGKQILALKKEQNPNTIILVEAKIEDGQLKSILMLSAEYLGDISRMLEGTI